ncbi:radical SAM protein [Desulfosporosinus sp. OT]|uniref:radical SAM protein n=1 Tax=Desulfosporosinus sp. OT TaxID=913865 RepID=UPI001FA6B5C5|nr:radical SAM protein [Desulfosporosinus sp. OT]
MIKRAFNSLSKNPEENIEPILNWCKVFLIKDKHKDLLAKVSANLLNKDNNWHQLAVRMLKDSTPASVQNLTLNLIINSILLGIPIQNKNSKKYGFSIPWSILIDPTENCNLRCKGCWAGDYEKGASLDLATIDRVVTEGKELGMFFYVISGGEPLTRKDDLIKLAKKHSDVVFLIFTNGTLIDHFFAKEAAQAGNMVFALSLEGLEKATNDRRGEGVFSKVMNAMEVLHDAGAFFGFSATYTRQNFEDLMSDDFIDMVITKGCYFGFFFTYVPVGGEADLEYMATPDQRAQMYQRIKYFRSTKPIFVADFWNDGEAVRGCIAGGRSYFHINASGEVEPCAFIHYSNCNIKEVSLLEALASPLFKSYQKRQPFNENHLCPCPLIDNPQMLADMVAESGAYSTQKNCPVNAQDMADRMRDYSLEWQQISNILNDALR